MGLVDILPVTEFAYVILKVLEITFDLVVLLVLHDLQEVVEGLLLHILIELIDSFHQKLDEFKLLGWIYWLECHHERRDTQVIRLINESLNVIGCFCIFFGFCVREDKCGEELIASLDQIVFSYEVQQIVSHRICLLDDVNGGMEYPNQDGNLILLIVKVVSSELVIIILRLVEIEVS